MTGVPCELCGTEMWIARGWDGQCPCLQCGGRHAVCACGLKWGLFQDPSADLVNHILLACPDNVIVVRELMRQEGGGKASTLEEMQQRLQEEMAKQYPDKMQDFTQSSVAQILLKAVALVMDTTSKHLDQAALEMFGDLKTGDDPKDPA